MPSEERTEGCFNLPPAGEKGEQFLHGIQWFSTGSQLSGDSLRCPFWEGRCATGTEREEAGSLLNVLQGTSPPETTVHRNSSGMSARLSPRSPVVEGES